MELVGCQEAAQGRPWRWLTHRSEGGGHRAASAKFTLDLERAPRGSTAWPRETAFVKISEFAAQSGLSPDTIRYYERIGLLPPSPRDQGGRRDYGQGDLAWASFVRKLQAMGMPMRDRLEYSRLRAEGASTTSLRRQMLEAHRATITARQKEMAALIAELDTKIDFYRDIESGIGESR